MIYSDLEEEIAGHHVHDVLEYIPEDIKQNDDFRLWHKQRDYRNTGQDIGELRGNEAWKLDKYKFIPMVEKAYADHPDFDWYLFIEGDTYLSWPSLVTWLGRLDPSKPLYMGSPTVVGQVWMAHGGSGFVLSRTAIQRFVGTGDEKPGARTHGEKLGWQQYGDLLVANILAGVDIRIHKVWPMLNGEKPSGLPFGYSHWCEPVITMHHVSARDINEIWKWDQARKPTDVSFPPHP